MAKWFSPRIPTKVNWCAVCHTRRADNDPYFCEVCWDAAEAMEEGLSIPSEPLPPPATHCGTCGDRLNATDYGLSQCHACRWEDAQAGRATV